MLRSLRRLSTSRPALLSGPGVRPEIAAELDLFTEWRKDFHRHPELGFEEIRTSGLVAERLKSFGVDHVETGVGRTGVVGTIVGKHPAGSSPTGVNGVGLRADMDCLPMHELNDVEHRSTTDGKMHACGHDGHTTMLLAAAKHLAETRNFAGTVQAIFQPAEEGHFGGLKMVEDGLFERFPCDEVYGMHNWPDLPQGQFGIVTGPLMAAADKVSITITGRGGHAAMPHLCVDPIAIGCQLVSTLQTLVSRATDPTDAVVFSVTQFHAGSAHNVIPDQAVLQGTVRSFKPESRDRMEQQIATIAEQLASAMGATATVDYARGYPATVNSTAQADLAAAAARAVVGDAQVVRDVAPSMGAEDFSYMLEKRPGCYAWLGQAGGPSSYGLHNVQYDFHDKLIPLGASWLVEMAESRMPAAP